MNTKIENIAKDAGVLRYSLQNGKLDIKETIQLLTRVERLANLPTGKKKSKERFDRQLSKL